ncbi:hypothetical protein [Streptomyces sp. ISL-11]|uniref:hypothetical protein n=1 Tax=Streptomyces sp. ISL-11 TaxID=2819174 RepID=UPI001BE60C2E|nr:hypothetical protein [Streptomyces sp. ISL-11]MBT2382396.1 hypothetical protein [Streptomyces sp. ISL-11]
MSSDVNDRVRPGDLPAMAFTILSEAFFDDRGRSVSFHLRDKRNTQDDPFDEYVTDLLHEQLPAEVIVLRADKPLVSPDAVIASPEEYELLRAGGVDYDPGAIFGLEVKKVDLGRNGKPARSTGLDYNSTPPCATVRVYAEDGNEIRIPGFYLFVALEGNEEGGMVQVHSMALVAGAALNKDVDLYDRITGTRTKQIGLGTYGDGANRVRPMLLFSNPLGWEWMLGAATLISERNDLADYQSLAHVRDMTRTVSPGVFELFHCYRLAKLSPPVEETAHDPFPQPSKRKEETAQRGRFGIDLRTLTLG